MGREIFEMGDVLHRERYIRSIADILPKWKSIRTKIGYTTSDCVKTQNSLNFLPYFSI